MELEEFYHTEKEAGDLYTIDYYFPKFNKVIELNGMEHFYPYSKIKNNFTNLKTKLLNVNGKRTVLGNGP